MRKLIFQIMISLDGYYEGTNQEIDWHNVDDEFNTFATQMLEHADMLLFGRKTYELMSAYWPSSQALENDPLVATFMNRLPKAVFSTTLKEAAWHNTRLINANAEREIASLKARPGKDMVILGSSQLATSLIPFKLINEFRIIVAPIVLGKGIPLFENLEEQLHLRLRNTKSFGSGNMLLLYEHV